MFNKYLAELSKEQLLELIELYAKNWLAHDGVWFQSIEGKFGMAEAMYHDEEAWKRFTVIEAKRIKEFLKLPENPGLEGLEQALHYRFYGNLNEHECIHEGNSSFTATATAVCRRHAAARVCRIILANRSAFTNTAVLLLRLTRASNAVA